MEATDNAGHFGTNQGANSWQAAPRECKINFGIPLFAHFKCDCKIRQMAFAFSSRNPAPRIIIRKQFASTEWNLPGQPTSDHSRGSPT